VSKTNLNGTKYSQGDIPSTLGVSGIVEYIEWLLEVTSGQNYAGCDSEQRKERIRALEEYAQKALGDIRSSVRKRAESA
jgi:hypothetical protein